MAIVDVVKYDGPNDVFAWKYPKTDLATWSQLVVNEAQEAVVYKGGKACDLFGSGQHKLTTENIPVLSKIIALPYGRRSPFQAEVWFVNKVVNLDIKWGTPDLVQLRDPKYNIMIEIQAYGQFGIHIEDSRKFLTKLVGTMQVFDKDILKEYFRGEIVTHIKDIIAKYLIEKQISILEINSNLLDISSYMKENISKVMNEYGISLENFNVTSIKVSEDDPSVKRLKSTLDKRLEMDVLGFDYQQERTFNTMDKAAGNEGNGAVNAGIGLGIGINGAMQGMSNILNPVNGKQFSICKSCGEKVEKNMHFCPSCGADMFEAKEKPTNKIKCVGCGNEYPENTKFCPECGIKCNPCPNCKASLLGNEKVCYNCGFKLPIKCPSCNNVIDANSSFCPECGQSLKSKCSECGNEIESGTKFCKNCGNKL